MLTVTAWFLFTGFAATGLAAPEAGGQPPAVSFCSDGVDGGDTLLLCGDGFEQPNLTIQRWLPPQPPREQWQESNVQRESLQRGLQDGAQPPGEPSGRLSRLIVSDIGRHTCAARLPLGGYLQVQVICLQTEAGAAAPRLINRPRLWWASPEVPAPGERMRLFGRNLVAKYGSGQAVWLRDAQGRLRSLEFGLPAGVLPGYDGGLTQPFEIGVELPSDLESGNYDVFVHNGSGGDLGWSDPLSISVRISPDLHPVVLNARDYGAIPDDDLTDSQALASALADAAAKSAGGIVQLESGVYDLSGNLKLPPGTRLRGAGVASTTLAALHDAPLATPFPQDNFPDQDAGYYKAVTGVTPMVWLPEACGMEYLTVRGAPETLCVLIGTRTGSGTSIALRNCQVINRHPVWFPNGKYRFPGNCVLIAGATDGLEIRHCQIEGSAPVTSMMQLLRRAVIAGNTLRSFPPGRTDCAAFRKPIECIIEDNYFLNAKRGLVIQPQGMAVHNLVANNRVEHIERGGNAGEVELWEGGTVVVGGRVQSADGRSLTSDGVTWESVDKQGNRRDLHGGELAGYVCLITQGRGLGQYRFVETLEGNTLTVDRPWDLPPGAGAAFVVTTSSIENLILNNSDRDGDAGMQIWGGCIANVISGHISEDTEGIILHAADRRKRPGSMAGMQTCWFNDILHCRFERGARLQFWPSRSPDPDLDDAGPLVFGNTVRLCLWGDSPRLPYQNQWYAFWERRHIVENPVYPAHQCAMRLAVKGGSVGDPDDPAWNALAPAATGNIIERNFVDTGWPVGIYESRSARGNLIPDTNRLLSAQGVLRLSGSDDE